MRPGDILTHCFTGGDMRIIDDAGRLRDEARRVWDSGVIMDIGHGAGSFSFETAEALMDIGHRPDVISSDIHQLSILGPMFDLPTCLAKFMALGMSFADTVAGRHRAPGAGHGAAGRGRHAPAGRSGRRRAVPHRARRLHLLRHPHERAPRQGAGAQHADHRRRPRAARSPRTARRRPGSSFPKPSRP